MKIGIYLGRFQPLHINHEKIIKQMINDFGYDNSILIIGSAHTNDERNPYSLDDRIKMIKNSFPDIKNIFYLDDNPDDSKWLSNFIKLVKSFNETLRCRDVTIYAGNKEDVWFLDLSEESSSFNIRQFNRTENDLSATKIRKALKDKDFEYVKRHINILNRSLIIGD